MWLKGEGSPQEQADEDQYSAFPKGIYNHGLGSGSDSYAAAEGG